MKEFLFLLINYVSIEYDFLIRYSQSVLLKANYTLRFTIIGIEVD